MEHFCHISYDYRSTISGTTYNANYLLRGTDEQIGARVAEAVQYALKNGSKTITLNPVAPTDVQDLSQR